MVAPYECKHRHRLFIGSERGPEGHSAHASVCPDCGTFHVLINGKAMDFQLVSDAQVEAAGVYAASLRDAEAGRAQ